MASQAVAVLAGLDTLVVNARYPVSTTKDPLAMQERTERQETHAASLLEQAQQWIDQAKQQKEPIKTTWEHEGRTFLMYPNGTPTHYYLLKNGLIDLALGSHVHNGALARIRFSSEYLWRRGVDEAVKQTHLFVCRLFKDMLEFQPAEMHLCADIAGLSIPRNYERVFISRATKWRPVKQSQLDKPIYRYHRLETLQFSGHKNPLSVSIYDKINEIEQQSQEKRWFYHLWKSNTWDEKTPVWRVECRVKREALHEMQIETIARALELVPSVWAYCVGQVGQKDGWLRMVEPNTRDTNRRRWKTASSWQPVQTAFATCWHKDIDIEAIQRERKREVNLDRAEKAIAGYTTTYGAWLQDELGPDDDVSVVLQRLYNRMLEIWEERGVDFQTLKQQKELIYHLA